MQLPKDREIDFKRYGLYSCGVVCGYLMIFIVGPFFFSMGVILVITGALFGLGQVSSAGWIFMLVGIIIFILGVIIPKVCGAILSKMIVRDVTDIVKENEPALNELTAAWSEGVNSQLQYQGALRQRQLAFPGLSSHQSQQDIFGRNMNVLNGPSSDQWINDYLGSGALRSASLGTSQDGLPAPPPYPGRPTQESTQPPPYPTAAAV